MRPAPYPAALLPLRRQGRAAAGALAAALLLALSSNGGAAPAEPEARWAGRAEPGFLHLTNEQGLPSEVGTSVAQDGQGYVWIGTASGLVRWDGYQFRSFKYEPATPGSLPDNLVQVLHVDAAGRLWIGTSGAGLARYEPATQRFVALSAGPQGLSHVSVRALADDGQGGLWVGTDGGLDHLDAGATPRVTRVATPGSSANASGLHGDRVVAVLRDRRGRLWAGTPRGLFRRDADAGRFVPVQLPPTPGAGDRRAPRQPESLFEDSAGRIWVGTNRTGTFVLDADGGAARAVIETQVPRGVPPLSALRVMAMAEAMPGEMWIGTLGQGIVVVDSASGRTHRIRHRPDMAASLVDNAVRGLYRDRSGLLWVATHGGVSRVDPRTTAVLTIAGPRGAQQARTDYSALFTHSDGRVWMGTHDDGVEILDPLGGPARALRPDTQRPDAALPPDVVVSMAQDDDGSVFVATYRGLFKVNRDATRVRRVTWPGRPPGGGAGPLLRDGRTLWVAGLNDGLWRMDLDSGRVRAAVSEPARTLTDSRITALARGPGGEIWIGTRNGLNRYDPARGEVHRIVAGQLAAGFVSSLLLDRAQRLWVGTYGGGVHLLMNAPTARPEAQPAPQGPSSSPATPVLPEGSTGAAAPHWRRIGGSEGLPDDNVNSMVEDSEGRLWVSTEDGLAVLDTGSWHARALRRAEGVVFLSYWTNAVTRTTAGELLFGASGGLTLVRPQVLPSWDYRPPVVATDVRVGDRPVTVPADGSVLEIPADANRIAVAYAALDYSSPERNRYEHRLEGYDLDWVRTDPQRRLAAYANLPPGDYRLLLRGSNREGRFGEAPLALPLRVLPAWHQTWPFRIAVLALLALALFAVVQLRTRALRARRRELQRLVEERTAELRAVSAALEEKSRVLERASIIDPLTGLHNRRFLSEHIENSLTASQRRAEDAARLGSTAGADTLFFLIDVDHFKRINDTQGHAAGDTVLVQLALRLQAAMRESDFVVRWGGEEFLAVARDTDRDRADELAERIRAGVADQPFRLDDGQQLHITCSVGHAAWPFLPAHPQAVDWLGVVSLADLGLLAAKRMGRDAWVGLHGTAAALPEGLLRRAQAAPLQLLQGGEIAVSSSRPTEHVAEAMIPG